MSERSRRSDMRVRKSVKSRKGPPLVERRALPTRERLRRAGADFERGDTGQITMRDSPLERAFARNAHARAIFSRAEISPSLVSRRPCRPIGINRSQPRLCNRPRRLFRDGEDGKPTLSSAKIPGGRASRRQDRIARVGMGDVSGNCARGSRPDIGLEQSAASLCGCCRTHENGFG
jgi:hypothetical protein